MVFVSTYLNAQQTLIHDQPEALFSQSLEFFELQQYDAAQQGFAAYQKLISNDESDHYIDAAYYETVCAMLLNQRDATEKVRAFNQNFPSSRWIPQMKFLTAKSYFASNQFDLAFDALNELDRNDLSRNDQLEFAYDLAYCQMLKGKNDAAIHNFNHVADTVNSFRINALYYRSHLYYLTGELQKAQTGFTALRDEKQFSKIIPLYELQIHYRLNDFDKVYEEGDEVLQEVDQRRRPEVARMLADACYRRGEYDKAMGYYAISEKGGSRFLTRQDSYQFAICRYKTGAYAEAIQLFQKVIKEDDALSQNASYYLGWCYNETAQTDFAKNAFLAAHKANIDAKLSEDAMFNYVKITLDSPPGPFNESLQLLDNYIENKGARADEAKEYRVRLFLHLRDFDNALASLDKMENRKGEYQSIYEKLTYSFAVQLFNKGSYVEASARFNSLISSKNNPLIAAGSAFWMAESSFRTKNYKEALRNYNRFLEMKPAAGTKEYPMAFYGLAWVSFIQKEYEKAIPLFKRFLQLPNSKDGKMEQDARLRLADCYFITRNYQTAAIVYDEAATNRKPDADYALFQRAQCLGAMKNYNDKTIVLDQLIKNYSKSAYYDQALYEMASTNLILDDQRAAIANFNKLINERPRSKYTRVALLKTGMLYYNNDQSELAIPNLKKVIENYPSTDESREAVNVLRSIYMEMNKLNDYFSYVKDNGIAYESVSEQDSLAFAVAERFYQESKDSQALSALQTYFKGYTDGAYLLKAHYYRLKCLQRSQSSIDIWPDIQYIIERKDNEYTDEVLLLAARKRYDEEKYAEAGNYYERLIQVSDQPLLTLEAIEGSMKSSYFTGKYSAANASAKLLLASAGVSDNQVLQAHYIAGKSYFEQRKFVEATPELLFVGSKSKSELGAEATYLTAVIQFEDKKAEQARKSIFDLSDRFAGYDFWVAKAFILLADVYVLENNVFQAKETLKSIIENYKGEDLRKIASQKLELLKDRE